uniref:Uncharacterized protein n=1 Tax=Pseudoalteromonas rubra TaxID=43658 RepID=A0A0F4QH00_9GAMM|nr:hypothetical protein TW77_19080 [Pseudoalteromonas rubra]
MSVIFFIYLLQKLQFSNKRLAQGGKRSSLLEQKMNKNLLLEVKEKTYAVRWSVKQYAYKPDFFEYFYLPSF